MSLIGLLLEVETDNIEAHLKSRGVDLSKTHVILDKENNKATFLLYNVSGKLVGIQEYTPNAPKSRNNVGRYITHVAKLDHTRHIAVWGLESVTKETKEVFIVEGIFDAIKLQNAGVEAIAVLSNNPVHLKQWFVILGKKIIAVLDNDKAGSKLKKFAHESYIVPDPYKDLGEMPQDKVNDFVKHILKR